MLENIIDMLLYALIAAVSAPLGTVLLLKLMQKLGYFRDLAIETLMELVQDEDFQKAIYSVGAIAGSGAKAGIGLNKKGGKRGLTDFIISIGAKYLGFDLDGESPQQQNKESNVPEWVK